MAVITVRVIIMRVMRMLIMLVMMVHVLTFFDAVKLYMYMGPLYPTFY